MMVMPGYLDDPMKFRKEVEMPAIPEPNLKTGVGHGHYRPLNRKKMAIGSYQKQHKKVKMAKKSKRRNRV